MFTLAFTLSRDFLLHRRPRRVCWCPYLPAKPLDIVGKVILLQHPDEEKRNLKTAPMLFHGLAAGRCEIFYGTRFPTSKHAGLQQLLNQPETYVLYPGPKSLSLTEVAKSHNQGAAYNLVLIDGTWPQAKSMYHHSPKLHSLPQVFGSSSNNFINHCNALPYHFKLFKYILFLKRGTRKREKS